MIQNLVKYLKFGSTYCAVEHCNNSENEYITLLTLKKRQNEFSIETQQQISSVKEIAETLNREQHLYLVINNKQVLSKLIHKELNEDKAVQIAYPNLKISDFFYEIIQLENQTLVSICRKEAVKKLINDYQQHHLNIVGFTLGNSAIIHLIPFMESSTVFTSNALITKKDIQITSIIINRTIEKTGYSINGLAISNEYSLTLASIIAYFSDSKTAICNFKNYSALISKNYVQQQFFRHGLKIGMTFLFVSLLLSFLLFSYYNGQVEELSEKARINHSYKEQLIILNKELGEKKKLANDIVNSASSKTSFYIDQIGTSLPTTLLLSTIAYQPLLKNIDTQKKILLNENTIQIMGTTTNGEDFSIWIKELEKFDWVKSVEIVKYGNGKKIRTVFELRVILK